MARISRKGGTGHENPNLRSEDQAPLKPRNQNPPVHGPASSAPPSPSSEGRNTGIPFAAIAEQDALRIEALEMYINKSRDPEVRALRLLAAATDCLSTLTDLAGGDDKPVPRDHLILERTLLARELHQVARDRKTYDRVTRKLAAKAVMALTNVPLSVFLKRIGVEGRPERTPASEVPTPPECRRVLRDTRERLDRLWPGRGHLSPLRRAKLCHDIAAAFPDVPPERLPSVDDLRSPHLRQSRLSFRLAAARLDLAWKVLQDRLKRA